MMSRPEQRHPATPSTSVRDTFRDDRPAGRVIGTPSAAGSIRKGVDKEGVIAIDNGALRIQPLTRPGWGRAGIAYGPYDRVNGLAFAVLCVNGHNTSQTGEIESIKQRLVRWLRASETDSIKHRLIRWSRNGHKKIFTQQLLRWLLTSPRSYRYLQPFDINENLAVGWFGSEVPTNPPGEGNTFVVHATGAENGELWTRVGKALPPVIRGLQNLPIYYIVILRERGAVYYVASLPNAHGMTAYPTMRPVALDPVNTTTPVYAGLHQSVLGQIGFRVDTRVYGAQVTHLPDLGTWFGTAHAADQLAGRGSLDTTLADVGGTWQITRGGFERTDQGAIPTASENLALLDPQTPTGLLHLLIEPRGTLAATAELRWRIHDPANGWSFRVASDGCELRIKEAGVWQEIAAGSAWQLQPDTTNSVQILDDGEQFSLYLNGVLVFDTRFSDTRFRDATGLGCGVVNFTGENAIYLRSFEAHPRSVPIPAALNLGTPWMRTGTQPVLGDEFDGAAGELTGRTTTTGGQIWQKNLGCGIIEVTGTSSARVRASVQQPNPGRTVYTVAWGHPDFADLQVQLTPPGTDRGQGENGRSGLIFWQDAENYIIINTWLDDNYAGASISSFFYFDGFEDIYDAVWTNVGKRVFWGKPYTLRVVFDGLHYIAFVNDEPVLYRAVTDIYPHMRRLKINRVGIVANWEWGNDTGTVFKHFLAKI